jgi:hypothetical protein
MIGSRLKGVDLSVELNSIAALVSCNSFFNCIFSSCNVGNNTTENITSTSETKTEVNKYDLTSTTEKDALYALITNILEIKFDEKELEGVTFSRENYKTIFPEKLIEKINNIIPAGSSAETIIKENDNIEFSSISPHYESKITFKQVINV